jgi:hypothetical protein
VLYAAKEITGDFGGVQVPLAALLLPHAVEATRASPTAAIPTDLTVPLFQPMELPPLLSKSVTKTIRTNLVQLGVGG